MINLRFFITLVTMFAMAYGILEVKTFLNENFVKNETPQKRALNMFLNGETVIIKKKSD